MATPLEQAIEDSGLKHSYIARKIGVSKTHLHSLVHGKLRFMDADEVVAICKVIGRKPGEFLHPCDADKYMTWLKKTIKASGKTEKEISAETGIHRTRLTNIVQGKILNIRPEEAEKLAAILGFNPSDLL